MVELQNHRLSDWLRWEGVSGDCLVQPLGQSRARQSRLLSTMCSQVFNISKDSDFTTSMGNPFLCFVILTAKIFFPIFRWNFLYFSCTHCLLSYHWALLKSAWIHFLCSLPLVPTHTDKIPLSLLFSGVNNLSCLNFFAYDRHSSLLILMVLHWIHSSRPMYLLSQRAQNWTHN